MTAHRHLRLPPIVLPVLLAALAAGCSSSPPPETTRYVLVHPEETIRQGPEGALSLRLGEVALAGHLRGISALRSDGRIEAFVYTGWAAPLSEMIADWVLADLRGAGAFRDPTGPGSPARTDLLLVLRVTRFEADLGAPAPQAVVAVDGTLFGDHDLDALGTWNWRASEELPDLEPGSIVAGLRTALASVSTHLVETLVARDTPRTGEH